jgi:hypothetical protein
MMTAGDWTECDRDGRERSCTIRPHEAGGYRVTFRVDGEPHFGRHCADLAEAHYVSTAWRQDTRRTR